MKDITFIGYTQMPPLIQRVFSKYSLNLIGAKAFIVTFIASESNA